MRQDDLRGAGAVGVDRADVATQHVEEAMHLTLGVMHSSGAAPAVRASEDRFRSVLTVDTLQLGGGDIQGLIPGQLDEGVVARAARRARPILQPAPTERRSRDTGFAICGRFDVGQDRCRVGVVRVWSDAYPSILDPRQEGTPV